MSKKRDGYEEVVVQQNPMTITIGMGMLEQIRQNQTKPYDFSNLTYEDFKEICDIIAKSRKNE